MIKAARTLKGGFLWALGGGKTTNLLTLVVALTLAVITPAVAATGGNFLLGRSNTASTVTSLIKSGVGPALQLVVPAGPPPMVVNAKAGKATNLNADKLDGQDSSAFAQRSGFNAETVIQGVGPLPKQTPNPYTSKGGTLLITANGSGYRSTSNTIGPGPIGMNVFVDGAHFFGTSLYANERNSHKTFITGTFVFLPNVPAGPHTIRIEPQYGPNCNTVNEASAGDSCTTTDSHDEFNVTVLELPK
jgi:hypothetical protein